MSKGPDRMVYRREDGTWANERNDADRGPACTRRRSRPNGPHVRCSKTKTGANL